MKYVIGGIVIAGAIIGVIAWLHGTPERASEPLEPTQPPPALRVDSAPGAARQTAPASNSSKPLPTKTSNTMNIETLKQGNGPAIANGQTASVQYTGMLQDGTVFDSTSKRGNQPFQFTLGAGQVIKGWDQGVLGMKAGEERRLTIPASLGYGASGVPGVIPGGATLIFDVTLEAIR